MYCICDKVPSETELTIQIAHSYITVYIHMLTPLPPLPQNIDMFAHYFDPVLQIHMHIHRLTHIYPPAQARVLCAGLAS